VVDIAALDGRCGFNSGGNLHEPKTPEWLAACELLAARYDHWKMSEKANSIRLGHPSWLVEHMCVEALLTLQAQCERQRVALEAELERQMEAQEENLPSSLARERGLVWLDGWFDLDAALAAYASLDGEAT
jgi:hypothetical protein